MGDMAGRIFVYGYPWLNHMSQYHSSTPRLNND